MGQRQDRTGPEELWAKALEGEPPWDESVAITSSDVNRQTAERMAALSIAAEDGVEAAGQEVPKPLSDQVVFAWMLLASIVLLGICIAGFILSGFGVLWMFAAAACAMFAFFAAMGAVMG